MFLSEKWVLIKFLETGIFKMSSKEGADFPDSIPPIFPFEQSQTTASVDCVKTFFSL